MDECNRWEQMITQLHPSRGGRSAALRVRAKTPRRRGKLRSTDYGQYGESAIDAARRTSIAVIERQADRSLLVSWSDATRCHYDEQRWICSKSRIEGRCALTGGTIEIGDAIYKPQWKGEHRPVNSAEMILAVALDRMAAARAAAR